MDAHQEMGLLHLQRLLLSRAAFDLGAFHIGPILAALAKFRHETLR
jgi:hypothetical protein